MSDSGECSDIGTPCRDEELYLIDIEIVRLLGGISSRVIYREGSTVVPVGEGIRRK